MADIAQMLMTAIKQKQAVGMKNAAMMNQASQASARNRTARGIASERNASARDIAKGRTEQAYGIEEMRGTRARDIAAQGIKSQDALTKYRETENMKRSKYKQSQQNERSRLSNIAAMERSKLSGSKKAGLWDTITNPEDEFNE